jgi:hypothetical protein
MGLICSLLGHKNAFERTYPNNPDNLSGKQYCLRCNTITGGVGNVVIEVAGGGGGGGGGISSKNQNRKSVLIKGIEIELNPREHS